MSTCKTCGKEIPKEARFCTYCGTLQDSPAPEEPAAKSAPAVQAAPAAAQDAAAQAPDAKAPGVEAPKTEAPSAKAPSQASSAPLEAMPAYPQAPKAPAPKRPGDAEDCAPRYQPLGAWSYFWLSVLFAVPVVGLVFMIVFSCNTGNINRRNFARSYLIRLVFGLVICAIAVLGCMLLANLFADGDLSYWLNPEALERLLY